MRDDLLDANAETALLESQAAVDAALCAAHEDISARINTKESASTQIQAAFRGMEAKQAAAELAKLPAVRAQAQDFIYSIPELRAKPFEEVKHYLLSLGCDTVDIDACHDKEALLILASKQLIEQLIKADASPAQSPSPGVETGAPGNLQKFAGKGRQPACPVDSPPAAGKHGSQPPEKSKVKWTCLCLVLSSATTTEATFRLGLSSGTGTLLRHTALTQALTKPPPGATERQKGYARIEEGCY